MQSVFGKNRGANLRAFAASISTSTSPWDGSPVEIPIFKRCPLKYCSTSLCDIRRSVHRLLIGSFADSCSHPFIERRLKTVFFIVGRLPRLIAFNPIYAALMQDSRIWKEYFWPIPPVAPQWRQWKPNPYFLEFNLTFQNCGFRFHCFHFPLRGGCEE